MAAFMLRCRLLRLPPVIPDPKLPAEPIAAEAENRHRQREDEPIVEQDAHAVGHGVTFFDIAVDGARQKSVPGVILCSLPQG